MQYILLVYINFYRPLIFILCIQNQRICVNKLHICAPFLGYSRLSHVINLLSSLDLRFIPTSQLQLLATMHTTQSCEAFQKDLEMIIMVRFLNWRDFWELKFCTSQTVQSMLPSDIVKYTKHNLLYKSFVAIYYSLLHLYNYMNFCYLLLNYLIIIIKQQCNLANKSLCRQNNTVQPKIFEVKFFEDFKDFAWP